MSLTASTFCSADVHVVGRGELLAALRPRMRAHDVARFDEVTLEQTGQHRLGHHAGADDPEPHAPEAFRTHVTAHLTAQRFSGGFRVPCHDRDR